MIGNLRHSWRSDEDEKLIQIVNDTPDVSGKWKEITSKFNIWAQENHRTETQELHCYARYYRISEKINKQQNLLSKDDKPIQVDKPIQPFTIPHTSAQFTPEADSILKDIVENYGQKSKYSKWNAVSKEFNLWAKKNNFSEKTGKQCQERYTRYLKNELNAGNWTQEEIATLKEKSIQYPNQWSKLTKFLPGRSASRIRNFFNTYFKKSDTYVTPKKRNEIQVVEEFSPSHIEIQIISNEKIRKSSWTQQEDTNLKNISESFPDSSWKDIASMHNKWAEKNNKTLRTRKQCRERYQEHLRADLKTGKFSEEEKLILIAKQQLYPNQWSKIAEFLPGRSQNSIKNSFKSIQRKEESIAKLFKDKEDVVFKKDSNLPSETSKEDNFQGTLDLTENSPTLVSPTVEFTPSMVNSFFENIKRKERDNEILEIAKFSHI